MSGNKSKKMKTYEDSNMTEVKCSQVILESVADCDIPTLAFLLLDPKKVQTQQNEDIDINCHNKLRDAFLLAVTQKSINTLRKALQQLIVTILEKCQEKLNSKSTVSLLRNFTWETNMIDEYDDAILRLHEVLSHFSQQVPKKIKDAFIRICQEKMIPDNSSNGAYKEFFVSSEMKSLKKICKAISEEEVCQMYAKLKNKIDPDFHGKVSEKALKRVEVNVGVLKNIEGMKETSFYCFIIGLLKEGLLNPVHTRHLCHYLQNEQTEAAPHFISDLHLYPLASNPPGICIIFNVEEGRPGSDKDLKKVEELFVKTFRYDVVPVKNPTKENVNDTIHELKAERNKFYDSLVVVFMSHGDKTNLTLTNNEKLHRRKELIEPIIKINWLAKKPKLFFIQACAGESRKLQSREKLYHLKYQMDSKPLGEGEDDDYMHCLYNNVIDLENIHKFADTLISYATKWYDYAARCEEKGSPYINILVGELKQYGMKESIQEVLLRVHQNTNMLKLDVEDVEEPHRQAPYFESSLQKKFIFPTMEL